MYRGRENLLAGAATLDFEVLQRGQSSSRWIKPFSDPPHGCLKKTPDLMSIERELSLCL